ncbi:MAG: polysaccharide export protein, partial [Bacteroidales bacterium]
MKRLLIPIFSCLLFSCKSPQQITYFQGLEQQIGVESVIDTSAMQIKIQPQDVLTITVNSIVPNSVSV